jgi:riboflavin-specific deaminase-like protein
MFIFSNLAMSLDGKIATRARGLFPIGSPYDRKHMQELRRQAEAILIGGETLRSYQKPMTLTGSKRPPINILLSSKLQGISPDWPFFKNRKVERILFISEAASPARVKKFASTCTLITLEPTSKKQPASSQIIHYLESIGIDRLLIEGGGGVMWDFASANWIDEYHVTLTPKIIGGQTAPTLVDGKGFLPQQILKLRLKKCKVIAEELYLTYSKR